MIHKFEITFKVTCQDNTVLEVPVTVWPSIYNVEDARVFFPVGAKGPVYDEFLLQHMLGEMRQMWADEKRTWPDGTEAVDVLDRMSLMLCDQLRRKNDPPPP